MPDGVGGRTVASGKSRSPKGTRDARHWRPGYCTIGADMCRRLRAAAIAVSLALLPTTVKAQAQSAPAAEREATELNLRAYVELLRSDLRTQKVAIITEMMEFTEAEDAAFWPIYREYDGEMSKLGDERVALIQEYANAFSTMSDATADALATKALDLESRRQEVKRKYYERFKQALSARTAARFLQVEHQLLLLIDLQISAALPIIK
jgi:CHAT domain-containing protein